MTYAAWHYRIQELFWIIEQSATIVVQHHQLLNAARRLLEGSMKEMLLEEQKISQLQPNSKAKGRYQTKPV